MTTAHIMSEADNGDKALLQVKVRELKIQQHSHEQAAKGDAPPAKTPPAFQQNGCKIVKWEHAALMKAIEDASTKR